MSDLEIKQEDVDSTHRITLQGSIDEDADFTGVLLDGHDEIEVDFEQVSAINSCGIREWVKLMSRAETVKSFKFVKCPKVIVDQINMVEGFLPSMGQVVSFYVPYYAEDSGDERNVLFNRGEEFDDVKLNPPEISTDSGEEMEMDVIEAKYFKFLKRG